MSAMPGQYNVGSRESRVWRRLRLAAVLLVPIAAACDPTDLLIPAGSIRIEPSSSTVPLQTFNNRTGFVVPVEIGNLSEKTVYYGGSCGGWRVEQSRLRGDEGPREWVTVFLPICALLPLPTYGAVPIDPGEVLVITVDTRGSNLGPSTALDGQYRVSFDLAVMKFGELQPLPHDETVSTPFTVTAN